MPYYDLVASEAHVEVPLPDLDGRGQILENSRREDETIR